MRSVRAALSVSLLVSAATAAACHDRSATEPASGLPNTASASQGTRPDSGGTQPGNPGTSHPDTTVGHPGNPGNPGTIVPAFTLGGTVVGRLAGADTMAGEPLNHATVTLLRVNMTGADSLHTDVVATVTTGADGAYTFGTVASGYYRLDAAPPSGSVYGPATMSIGPQTVLNVVVRFSLPRR